MSAPDNGGSWAELGNPGRIESGGQSLADFDEADYLPLLEPLDITDEQKSEFLQSLWDLMRSFVELKIPRKFGGQSVAPMIEGPSSESGSVE